MSDQAFVRGLLHVLKEAVEGGEPGRGTAFLDSTLPDGSNNRGLLATLDRLSAEQASNATPLGLSVAGHVAHVAFHMEATLRYVRGDRTPNDWPGSFEPRVVNDAAWADLRARLRLAYENMVDLAHQTPSWDGDEPGGLAATLAHVSYHLGAVRQTIKLA